MKKLFLFLLASIFLFGCNDKLERQTEVFVLSFLRDSGREIGAVVIIDDMDILGATSVCGRFMLASGLENITLPTTEQMNKVILLDSLRRIEHGFDLHSYLLVAEINFLPKPFPPADGYPDEWKRAINPIIKSDWKIVFGRYECRDLSDEPPTFSICQFIISERIATNNKNF